MAIKHVRCHAGLDPASRPIMDSGFRRNDGFDVYCCRSNNLTGLVPLREIFTFYECIFIESRCKLETTFYLSIHYHNKIAPCLLSILRAPCKMPQDQPGIDRQFFSYARMYAKCGDGPCQVHGCVYQ